MIRKDKEKGADLNSREIAIHVIKKFEGLALKPYRCPAGMLTIGYGHVIQTNEEKLKKGITKEKAEELLLADLAIYERGVKSLIKVPLTDYQTAALLSFSFNLGLTALAGSTLLRHINNNEMDKASDEFGKWVYVHKVKLKGLVTRRELEKKLFSGEVVV